MDTIHGFIVAQAASDTLTTNSAPPAAVPDPGLDADGRLIVNVTALWILTLVIVFVVFAYTPKLYRRIKRRSVRGAV